MQLGELQSQLTRFHKRGASVVAISVDEVNASRSIIRRLKLSFNIVTDQNQAVMQSYGVRNPDTQELALHAVYIVDETRKVIYRKVASRRPKSQELLEALDHHYDLKMANDVELAQGDWQFAYPQNNFQTLIEIAAVDSLPLSISSVELNEIVTLLERGQTDDSIIAFRRFVSRNQSTATRDELLDAAAWLTRHALDIDAEAIVTGKALSASLARDSALAKPDLETLRALIRRKQGRWGLSYAKSMLRGYRELVLAAE